MKRWVFGLPSTFGALPEEDHAVALVADLIDAGGRRVVLILADNLLAAIGIHASAFLMIVICPS